VFPWPDAKVRVILRYTPATSKTRGAMEHLYGVYNNEGYFATYFTDKEIEQLKTGEYSIEIYHPSYLEMNESYPVISYPFEKLSTEKESVKGYKMSSKSQEFENLGHILESIEKLKGLFAALKTYANDHQGNYPGTIGLLDIKADDFQWLAQNVEYIGDAKAQTTSKPAETVLAYDKALLEKCGSTLVLFRDGHIEFCWPRQLEILGILRTDIEVLH